MIINVNFKLGREKYVIVDCMDPVLIDLSVEGIKIMSLVFQDSKENGEL